MTGLLLDGERENIQPLAARLVDSAEAEIEGMRQRFQRLYLVHRKGGIKALGFGSIVSSTPGTP